MSSKRKTNIFKSFRLLFTPMQGIKPVPLEETFEDLEARTQRIVFEFMGDRYFIFLDGSGVEPRINLMKPGKYLDTERESQERVSFI